MLEAMSCWAVNWTDIGAVLTGVGAIAPLCSRRSTVGRVGAEKASKRCIAPQVSCCSCALAPETPEKAPRKR